MTQDQILIYPTIFEENTDDPSGYYYTVTSPNIDGMVTEGTTRAEAALMAVDAIATMVDGEVYPPAQDPSDWQLAGVLFGCYRLAMAHKRRGSQLGPRLTVFIYLCPHDVPSGLNNPRGHLGVIHGVQVDTVNSVRQ
ncbi:type II toxin-antitoxin system HicB family antitoxin [Lacticaseibacillus pantheris]